MTDKEDGGRFSSGKAVLATFMIFGLLFCAGLVFLLVLIQRAC
jgi:hypothetical protein